MKLTLLGTGTMVPSLQRHSSALLIEDSGTRSLVDFGYGALHQLLRLGIDYHGIDRIFFTHIHPDHMYDLVPFLFACRYPDNPRKKNLQIVAGPGFTAYFDGLRQAYQGWLDSDHFSVDVVEQDESTRDYGGLTVSTRKVKHLPISRAFRFTDRSGKVLTISGDSDHCESLIELGRDADLLVLNCAMPDEKKFDGHLSPTPAAQIAAAARCKKLCLTHFYPPCDLAQFSEVVRKQYSGELVLAEDLMEIQI